MTAITTGPSVRKFILLSSIGVSRPDESGFMGKLLGDPLRAKARGEEALRRSKLESYCIVRAAGLREGDGVKREIVIGQGDSFGRSGVSRLDVASMLVQALVQVSKSSRYDFIIQQANHA